MKPTNSLVLVALALSFVKATENPSETNQVEGQDSVCESAVGIPSTTFAMMMENFERVPREKKERDLIIKGYDHDSHFHAGLDTVVLSDAESDEEKDDAGVLIAKRRRDNLNLTVKFGGSVTSHYYGLDYHLELFKAAAGTSNVVRIQALIAKNKHLLLGPEEKEYVLHEALQAIREESSEILSCYKMVSMMTSIQGFTGIIDNINTLPHEVVEFAYQGNSLEEGYEILRILLEKGFYPGDEDLRERFDMLEVIKNPRTVAVFIAHDPDFFRNQVSTTFNPVIGAVMNGDYKAANLALDCGCEYRSCISCRSLYRVPRDRTDRGWTEGMNLLDMAIADLSYNGCKLTSGNGDTQMLHLERDEILAFIQRLRSEFGMEETTIQAMSLNSQKEN